MLAVLITLAMPALGMRLTSSGAEMLPAQAEQRVRQMGIANAVMNVLDPKDPIVNAPNKLDAADYVGWVQERGLYFLSQWGDRFTPLLEMADPGEEATRGSLLVADHGEGTYVYTGLAFFRQLPEGVPGAYRLLVNLLSLGRQP